MFDQALISSAFAHRCLVADLNCDLPEFPVFSINLGKLGTFMGKHFRFLSRSFFLLGIASVLLPDRGLQAADWPQWRGPRFDGSSPEKNLPESWSLTEGIAWKKPLPARAGSTPITWGDRIFLTSPDANKNLLLLCLDRKTGDILWQKESAVGDRTGERNNMASPSPVTDGKSVFALFGTSDLVAYDFGGEELWRRNLGKDFGKFAIMWLYGSSPLLYKGNLYIQVLQRDVANEYSHAVDGKVERESYLLCIDPKTGKDLWRSVRPTDAIKESSEAYSTPTPFEGAQGTEIVLLGGNYLTGHSPKDGKELWRAGGLNPKQDPWWRIVPSPVMADGIILASAPKRDPVFAYKTGGKGDITATHLAWKMTENSTDWSTPLFYNGKIFVLDGDKKVLSCVDPKTGEKKWSGSLNVKEIFWSSPTGADGKIYCIGEGGTVVVCSAGDEFKVLSTIPMGEGPCRSSIVVANEHLYIRTAQNLYSIGK